MKKVFIFIIISITILSGCNNDEAYNNAIQKGLDYIASEEYQKAEGAFELALEEKNEDEKATALLEQTIYYQDALKVLDEGELDSAKEKAKKVISIENGSSALIKKAEEIITSIEELKAEEDKSEQDNATKEKNEKESEKQDKEKTATEERPAKYDLELNPNQEGFYNDEYYSGEQGAAGPDEYHTVEDARAMGYEVIPISRHPEYGTPMIEGLDKPYPYDRWEEDYEGGEHGFTHIEGKLYEFQGEQVEFVHTEIMQHKDEYRAVFLMNDDYVDFGF